MKFSTLSNYHLIDWWCDANICLFTWWFDSSFLLQQFGMGNRWIRTRIDYHPFIKSESTNLVCKPTGYHTNKYLNLFVLRRQKMSTG